MANGLLLRLRERELSASPAEGTVKILSQIDRGGLGPALL